MTVADFIEWLKTQDQDATVLVVKHTSRDGTATTVNFDPSDNRLFEYSDFRGDRYKGSAVHGLNELLIGEHNG